MSSVMGIDDLGFVGFFLGTRVLVLEKSSDGWWRGQYEGQVGWFPSNYVKDVKGRGKTLLNPVTICSKFTLIQLG